MRSATRMVDGVVAWHSIKIHMERTRMFRLLVKAALVGRRHNNMDHNHCRPKFAGGTVEPPDLLFYLGNRSFS